MVNFPEHQARARAITRRFVALWALGMLGLIALTILAVVVLVQAWNNPQWGHPSFVAFDPSFYAQALRSAPIEIIAGSALVVLSVTGLVSLWRWHSLKGHGIAVAHQLGAVPVKQDTTDPHERQALNIVQEMALAGNMPVPTLCVIACDTINAFAAGHTPQTAALGMTRGALQKLNRAELQGVVAHELGHIENGDMSLNMKAVAAISGMTFLFVGGRVFVKAFAGRRDVRLASLAVFGIVIMALGLVGVAISHLIQAAISRQREYLADATAVQFTRNPKGIASALAKIKAEGSRIPSAQASDFAHFYFSANASRLLATHPPLDKRLARLRPQHAYRPKSMKRKSD